MNHGGAVAYLRLLMLMMSALLLSRVGVTEAAVDLTPYLKQDAYERIKISPDGAYYAATAPLDDRTALVIVRRSDMTVTARIAGAADSVVEDFWWANNERVVTSLARKYGSRDRPSSIGELYAVSSDGRNSMLLASPYGTDARNGVGATFKSSFESAVYLLDPLPGDERNVLVYAVPITSDPYIRIEKLDTYNRRRTLVAQVRVRGASFVSDQTGEVRFALGSDTDNVSKLYYRDARGQQWRQINNQQDSGHRRHPLGFSADGKLTYLQVEQANGPDLIVSWDPANGDEQELLRDEVVDPYRILYELDGKTPIGASYMSDRVRNRFFDENSTTARFYRSLEKSFCQDALMMTSATSDGRLVVLLYVWSDRNNGDYFLFDTQGAEPSAFLVVANGSIPARSRLHARSVCARATA